MKFKSYGSVGLRILSVIIWIFFTSVFIIPSAFAGYIGYDAQNATTYTMAPSYCWGNKYSSDFYIASSGDVIDTFIIWCNPQNNNSKVVFGLYTVSAGVIGSKAFISDTLTLSGSGISRWVKPADINLNSGTQYTICLDIVGIGGPAVCYASQTNAISRSNSAVFPDPWTDDLAANLRYSVAAHYKNKSAGSLERRRALAGGDK